MHGAVRRLAGKQGGLTRATRTRGGYQEALRNLDRWDSNAGMLFCGRKLEGFSIGEKFGDMAINHVEKATRTSGGRFR